jgi:hypothetical protein
MAMSPPQGKKKCAKAPTTCFAICQFAQVDLSAFVHVLTSVSLPTSHSKSIKDAVQSVCKQRLCLHFDIQHIEFYSATIYIFMILEYNKLSRDNNQALQEHKMK